MSISWSWSTVTDRFAGKSFHQILEICQVAGLKGLEGEERFYMSRSPTELDAAATAMRTANMEMETVHLPFCREDDLACFYETTRRAAVRKVRDAMERSARLGARIGILHPSTAIYDVATEGMTPFLNALEKSLNELLPAAEQLGLQLAIENMPGTRFGSRPDHFVIFRERFGHPHLKFCLDTGHALLSMRTREGDFFPAMGRDLVAFHLHDNPGNTDAHLAPGHGRIDWHMVFRGMAALNYRGIACIEAVPFDFGPDYTADAWRGLVTATRALAEQALG